MNNIKPFLFFLIISILTSCSGRASKKTNTSYLEATDYGETAYTTYNEEKLITFSNSINVSYTEQYSNTITIPVKINGMELEMIFDTGASTTCITVAEAQYLYGKGKLTNKDFIGEMRYQTADGKISAGLKINLKEVRIGHEITLYNIEALVVNNQQAPLLIGQSVMKNFREISVDRKNKVIKFYK